MKVRGLRGPLVRGAGDFVVLEEDEYVDNRIETLVSIHSDPFDGTGELEWDQETGFMTEYLRHRNTTRGRLEMVTLHGVDQLRRWEPDLVFTKIAYTKRENTRAVDLEIDWDHKRLAATGSAKVEVAT